MLVGVAAAAAIFVGIGVGVSAVSVALTASAIAIVLCLVLPWLSVSLALVVLGFAGRFELPPLAVGLLDIAFWAVLGLLIALTANSNGALRAGSQINAISISTIAFVTSIGVGLVATYQDEYAQEKAARIIFYASLFILITQALLRNIDAVCNFLLVFIAFVGGLAVVSVALTLQSRGILDIQRIAPPGGGPITLARLLGFAAIASIGLAYFHPLRRLLLLNAAIMTLLTFATGSRGPALFLCMVLVLFPILAALNAGTRAHTKGVLAGIVAIALLSVPISRFAIEQNVPFATRFALLFEQDRGASVETRERLITTGLQLARESDFMGSGVGSWALLTTGESGFRYPHNIFIELLVESGLVGVLTFVIFIMAVAGTALRGLLLSDSSVHSALMSVSLLSFIYALLVAQTSGDLYDNRYIWFYAGLVSCIAAIIKESAIQQTGDFSGGSTS